jgi:Caspase domain
VRQGQKETRCGTDKDRDRLTSTFLALGFDVCVKENLEGIVIDRDIKKIGQRFDSTYQCLVICIFSHGTEGCVMGSDWAPVQINSLKYALNSRDCPNLHNKPKIFIIQACQGDYTQWTNQPAPYKAPQNGQQNSDAPPFRPSKSEF